MPAASEQAPNAASVGAPAAEANPSQADPVERRPVARELGLPVPSAPSASPRPRKEIVVPRSEPAVVKAPAPRAAGIRCSDILQKASLEPLTADEADYLKRECR